MVIAGLGVVCKDYLLEKGCQVNVVSVDRGLGEALVQVKVPAAYLQSAVATAADQPSSAYAGRLQVRGAEEAIEPPDDLGSITGAFDKAITALHNSQEMLTVLENDLREPLLPTPVGDPDIQGSASPSPIQGNRAISGMDKAKLFERHVPTTREEARKPLPRLRTRVLPRSAEGWTKKLVVQTVTHLPDYLFETFTFVNPITKKLLVEFEYYKQGFERPYSPQPEVDRQPSSFSIASFAANCFGGHSPRREQQQWYKARFIANESYDQYAPGDRPVPEQINYNIDEEDEERLGYVRVITKNSYLLDLSLSLFWAIIFGICEFSHITFISALYAPNHFGYVNPFLKHTFVAAYIITFGIRLIAARLAVWKELEADASAGDVVGTPLLTDFKDTTPLWQKLKKAAWQEKFPEERRDSGKVLVAEKEELPVSLPQPRVKSDPVRASASTSIKVKKKPPRPRQHLIVGVRKEGKREVKECQDLPLSHTFFLWLCFIFLHVLAVRGLVKDMPINVHPWKAGQAYAAIKADGARCYFVGYRSEHLFRVEDQAFGPSTYEAQLFQNIILLALKVAVYTRHDSRDASFSFLLVDLLPGIASIAYTTYRWLRLFQDRSTVRVQMNHQKASDDRVQRKLARKILRKHYNENLDSSEEEVDWDKTMQESRAKTVQVCGQLFKQIELWDLFKHCEGHLSADTHHEKRLRHGFQSLVEAASNYTKTKEEQAQCDARRACFEAAGIRESQRAYP